MSAPLPRAYLDTNVFIAAFERTGAHSDHAWWILRAIEANEIVGLTSELTLSEILVKPLELHDVGLTAAYKEIFTSGNSFTVLPVARPVLLTAAELRAQRKSIRLPDAIHAATAIAQGCDFFVSDDGNLPVPSPLRHLPVSPFTVDDMLRPPA